VKSLLPRKIKDRDHAIRLCTDWLMSGKSVPVCVLRLQDGGFDRVSAGAIVAESAETASACNELEERAWLALQVLRTEQTVAAAFASGDVALQLQALKASEAALTLPMRYRRHYNDAIPSHATRKP